MIRHENTPFYLEYAKMQVTVHAQTFLECLCGVNITRLYCVDVLCSIFIVESDGDIEENMID